jgi:hypothetical protein
MVIADRIISGLVQNLEQSPRLLRISDGVPAIVGREVCPAADREHRRQRMPAALLRADFPATMKRKCGSTCSRELESS